MCDIVIIGAGAAGLAAALELRRAGMHVRLVEARDRIGGRIFTRRRDRQLPVELGAEFIHGKPAEIWQTARCAGLTLFELANGHFAVERGGAVREIPGFWERLGQVTGRMSAQRLRDRSFLEFLDAEFPARDPRNRELRALSLAYIEGFNAAEAGAVSEKALAVAEQAAEKNEGTRLFRVFDGYDKLCLFLLESAERLGGVELRCETVVSELRWERGRVRLKTHDPLGRALEELEASRALITVPLGVELAKPGEAGAIRFEPELASRRRAAEALRMGEAIRITLCFREPVWPESDRLSFLQIPGQPFPVWWTALPVQSPVLTGWAGGPAARRLAGLAPERLLELAFVTLQDALRVERARLTAALESWHFHDWQSDPFSRGAYSYVTAGGLAAQRELAAPVEDTLYFAGEALHCGGLSGTVDGAMASGRLAACEIIRSGVTPGAARA